MIQSISLKRILPRCIYALRTAAVVLGTGVGAALVIGMMGAPVRGASIQHGTLDLVAETAWISPGKSFAIGLHFKMDPGWHIYWKNPGDSGEPPRVTWQLPQGITAGEIEWPAPQRMMTSTIMNFVYDGEVLLIVPMRAAETFTAMNSPVHLDASVRVLICSPQMCVPSKAQLSLSLRVKNQPQAADPNATALFSASRARLPKLVPAGWQFSWTDRKDSLVLRARTSGTVPTGSSPAYFFPMEDSPVDYSAKQDYAPTAAGFQITLRKSNQTNAPLTRLRGVLVLADGQAYLLDVRAGSPAARRTGS